MPETKPPSLAQLIADERSKKAQATSSGTAPGLAWMFEFRIDDGAEWFRDHQRLETLLQSAARMSWFNKLDVLGRDHGDGIPFHDLDAAREALLSNERITITFARGEPRATQWINQAEILLSFIIAPFRLEVRGHFDAKHLAELRSRAIDDPLQLLHELREAWNDTQVTSGLVYPHPEVAYVRASPPRITRLRSDALVDIFDPSASDEAKTLASAPVPANTKRIERDGLVILRWIDDPSDSAAMAAACSEHERWIVELEDRFG